MYAAEDRRLLHFYLLPLDRHQLPKSRQGNLSRINTYKLIQNKQLYSYWNLSLSKNRGEERLPPR
jgi:hypothetical protein